MLNDWNSGKLRYFTEPPEHKIVSEFQPELVAEFVKEFDLDNLQENIRVLVDCEFKNEKILFDSISHF